MMLTAFGLRRTRPLRLRKCSCCLTGKKHEALQPKRSEVWLADLGLAAKVRPVLVISVAYADADYALVCVIPRTASARGSQFEVGVEVPWLQPGAYSLQGMLAVPAAKFLRKLGALDAKQMQEIESALKRWLGI